MWCVGVIWPFCLKAEDNSQQTTSLSVWVNEVRHIQHLSATSGRTSPRDVGQTLRMLDDRLSSPELQPQSWKSEGWILPVNKQQKHGVEITFYFKNLIYQQWKKKCVWFNFTFSCKYHSYSILVTFTFSCHVCSQNYSGSTNENRLRFLWLLLTSTEITLQKWFFFFLCHTQLPPLEVRPSCNRSYSVILSRGWYSYSHKVSSYC